MAGGDLPGSARESDIVEELAQHLEDRYERLRADGTHEVEARRLALEELREPDALARQMRSLGQAHVPAPMTHPAGVPARRSRWHCCSSGSAS